MKFWITVYALAHGIREVDAEEPNGSMLVVCERGKPDQSFFGEGKEWHRSRSAAVSRAEEMRTNKLELLRKQVAKLEMMRFE